MEVFSWISFIITFLLIPVIIFLGLIKPSLVIRWGNIKNRKKVLKIFIPCLVLMFILTVITINLSLTPEEKAAMARERVIAQQEKDKENQEEELKKSLEKQLASEKKARKEAEKKAKEALASKKEAEEELKNGNKKVKNTEVTLKGKDVKEGEENDPLYTPSNFKPVYTILSDEDVSISTAKRFRIRISLPLGLSKKVLEYNLKHAAKKNMEKYNPNALIVFAYRHDDSDKQNYSAGRLIFAPYGDWSRAKESVPITKFKTVINFTESYFNPQKTFNLGTKVKLMGEGSVDISNSESSWGPENIIITATNGSIAEILEIYKYQLETEQIRYKVKITILGKEYEGWVFDYDCVE